MILRGEWSLGLAAPVICMSLYLATIPALLVKWSPRRLQCSSSI